MAGYRMLPVTLAEVVLAYAKSEGIENALFYSFVEENAGPDVSALLAGLLPEEEWETLFDRAGDDEVFPFTALLLPGPECAAEVARRVAEARGEGVPGRFESTWVLQDGKIVESC